jgi:hypothetical protein
MTTNAPLIDRFCEELARDRELAGCAQSVAHALSMLDREADDSPDAAELFSALLWLAAQPKPLAERIDRMHKLTGLRGEIVIADMREWSGWR